MSTVLITTQAVVATERLQGGGLQQVDLLVLQLPALPLAAVHFRAQAEVIATTSDLAMRKTMKFPTSDDLHNSSLFFDY